MSGAIPQKRKHVFSISRKELNIEYRTRNYECRMIIDGCKAYLINPISKLELLISEGNELISIFVASVKTAKQRKDKKTS